MNQQAGKVSTISPAAKSSVPRYAKKKVRIIKKIRTDEGEWKFIDNFAQNLFVCLNARPPAPAKDIVGIFGGSASEKRRSLFDKENPKIAIEPQIRVIVILSSRLVWLWTIFGQEFSVNRGSLKQRILSLPLVEASV
jgi:hypothetical protein